MKFYNPTIDLQCLLILSNEKLSNCQKDFSSSVCTVVIIEALHFAQRNITMSTLIPCCNWISFRSFPPSSFAQDKFLLSFFQKIHQYHFLDCRPSV